MNLEELERLANAATPGPWRYKENRCSFYIRAADGTYVSSTANGYLATSSNAAYIAAANPQTMLALLAVVKLMPAALDALDNFVSMVELEGYSADNETNLASSIRSALAGIADRSEGEGNA